MPYKLFSAPIITFSVIVMLFSPGSVYSQENPANKNKSRIVVLDLRANGVPETVAKMATVIIQSELINNGKLTRWRFPILYGTRLV
jgi:hypothetical protein